jgi:hypothetical protein
MLFIIKQQEHPAFIIDVIELQHASIMAVQAGSPLVQVTRTPLSVGSHLQWAMVSTRVFIRSLGRDDTAEVARR